MYSVAAFLYHFVTYLDIVNLKSILIFLAATALPMDHTRYPPTSASVSFRKMERCSRSSSSTVLFIVYSFVGSIFSKKKAYREASRMSWLGLSGPMHQATRQWRD